MNSAIEQLQALLGTGKISTSPSVLEQRGRDENFPEVRPPLAVAYAESREDVQTALEWCRFIGSAGTLGVITELTVQLHPVLEHIHTLRVFFPSILAAAQAAYAIMASALPVARMELVDELGMQSINRYMRRGYIEQTALFLEFHSSTAAAIEEEVRLVEELVRDAVSQIARGFP